MKPTTSNIDEVGRPLMRGLRLMGNVIWKRKFLGFGSASGLLGAHVARLAAACFEPGGIVGGHGPGTLPVLAVTEPVEGGLLVVEGWVSDFTMKATVAEFKRHPMRKFM